MSLLDKLCDIQMQYFEEAFTKQQLDYIMADYKTIVLKAIVNGEISSLLMALVNIRRNVTLST